MRFDSKEPNQASDEVKTDETESEETDAKHKETLPTIDDTQRSHQQAIAESNRTEVLCLFHLNGSAFSFAEYIDNAKEAK